MRREPVGSKVSTNDRFGPVVHQFTVPVKGEQHAILGLSTLPLSELADDPVSRATAVPAYGWR
jgi:hypothetical protein